MAYEDGDLGRAAFEAYSNATGGKTYDDKPIPPWEEISEETRRAWRVAGAAAYEAMNTHGISERYHHTSCQPCEIVATRVDGGRPWFPAA